MESKSDGGGVLLGRNSLRRSNHSIFSMDGSEISETDSGWSDVYRDDDESLEDFDNLSARKSASRKAMEFDLERIEEVIPQHVQLQAAEALHTESAGKAEHATSYDSEEDMWNSSGDWDGSDTEELVEQQPSPTTKPERRPSVLASFLEKEGDIHENDNNNSQGSEQEDDQTADSSAAAVVLAISSTTSTSSDDSTEEPPPQQHDPSLPVIPLTEHRHHHDLSVPLGLDPLDVSEEIVFHNDASETENNVRRSREDVMEEEEEEEEWEDEDEGEWEDEGDDDDGDWDDEEEDDDADEAEWDEPVESNELDEEDWGDEEEEDARNNIDAAEFNNSHDFANQFVVSSPEKQTEPSRDESTQSDQEEIQNKPENTPNIIEVAAEEEEPWDGEETKEEIQPWQESESSYSANFEPIDEELNNAPPDSSTDEPKDIDQPNVPEDEKSREAAPTITPPADNPQANQNQSKQKRNRKDKHRPRYHPNKDRPRTPEDWECLLAKWETMEKAKLQREIEEQPEQSPSQANNNSVLSPPSLQPERSDTKPTNPKNMAKEDKGMDDSSLGSLLEESSGHINRKTEKKGANCFGNGIFPFCFKLKRKNKNDQARRQ